MDNFGSFLAKDIGLLTQLVKVFIYTHLLGFIVGKPQIND